LIQYRIDSIPEDSHHGLGTIDSSKAASTNGRTVTVSLLV